MVRNAKYLLLLAVPLASLAIAASPAAAEFETSNEKSTEGTGKTGVITVDDGSAILSCEAAPQDYILFKLENGMLVAWFMGDDLFERVGFQSAACSILSPVKSTATVSECDLRLLQAHKGETTGIPVKFESACTAKVQVSGLKCELVIPNSTENSGLKSAAVKNSGSNMEAKLEVSGITETAKGVACLTLGIAETTKEGTMKGTLTFNELKEI